MTSAAARIAASTLQVARETTAAARAASAHASAALAAARTLGGANAATVAYARSARDAANADLAAARAAEMRARAEYGVAQSAASAAAASVRAADAADLEAQAAMRAANAQNRHHDAVNQNNRVASRGATNTANLAAQFQDIAVSAQMSMNPMQIALQQGTQISAAFGNMGAAEAVRSLGAAFLSVLSPVSLFVIAAVGAVAALIQFVNWGKVMETVLHGVADVLEVAAPYFVGLAAAAALVYAPAIIAGVWSLIAALKALAVQAVATGAAMALANPVGAFVIGVTLAIAALNYFRDEVTQIFGRDIVADAKYGANQLIGLFVGTFNGLVEAWDTLPAAFADIINRSAQNFIDGIRWMVNEALLLLGDFYVKMNSVFGTSMERPGLLGPVKIENPYAGAVERTDSILKEELDKAQQVDYVGDIAAGAIRAAGAVHTLADWMGTVEEKKKKGSGGKTEGEKYDEIVRGAQRDINDLIAKRDALYMTEEAAAALRYEQELLNQAQQKGVSLGPEQRMELQLLAETYASLQQSIKTTEELIGLGKDVAKGFISDIIGGLREGKTLWDSFADAALNALNKVTDKLVDMALDAVIGNIFGSLFGGGFGTTSGFADMLGLAKGGVFAASQLVPFARGGVVDSPTVFPFARGVGLMGEAGPEAIMPLKRGSDGKLGVAGGGGGTNVVTNVIVNNAPPGTTTRKESRTEGNTEFRTIFVDLLNEAIANGDADESLSSRNGIQPTRVARG
jgi:hypothetical protein